MKSNIKKSIDKLINLLISTGLIVDQNFTSISYNEIKWSGNDDVSICLKNIDYREVYSELIKSRIYNMKFVDGSLIQLQYKFKGNSISEHRLAYFPSPLLDRYTEDKPNYDPINFEEDIYRDIIDKFIITSPIRIDYTPEQFVEDEHPMCHMHFGQIEGCRIPVSRPIHPDEFMKFIIKNFYNKFFIKYMTEFNFESLKIDNTITNIEKKSIHINVV